MPEPAEHPAVAYLTAAHQQAHQWATDAADENGRWLIAKAWGWTA